MPRSIWRGVVSFGMVAIPVRLYLATESKSKVSFNLLCPEHQVRIKNKRWCPEGDHEIVWNDAVRGYEYEKDSYVIMEDEDLDKLPLSSTKSIDIAGFVNDAELPGELYYQSAYYLEPEKPAAKPYALLHKTLEQTGRVALAKFALRERERLVSLRSHDGALVMNTLHWPDEIRSTEELDLPSDVKVTSKEVAMAANLVDAMAMEFEPDEFKDDYKEALMKIVRAKVEGREDLVAAPEPEAETTVVDLMAALKASVEKAKRGEKPAPEREERAEESEERPAARRKAAASGGARAARRKAS
jgi:DNA end-binding protein Ku